MFACLSRKYIFPALKFFQYQGLDFKDNRPKDIADLFHDPCKKTIEDNTAGVSVYCTEVHGYLLIFSYMLRLLGQESHCRALSGHIEDCDDVSKITEDYRNKMSVQNAATTCCQELGAEADYLALWLDCDKEARLPFLV